MSHPDGVADVGFVYDQRGLLREVTGPAGAASYTYDGDGRLLQRLDAAGTHVFTWTDIDELDTLTDGVSGVVFDYDWDVASQVDVVTTTSGLTRDYPVRRFGSSRHRRVD